MTRLATPVVPWVLGEARRVVTSQRVRWVAAFAGALVLVATARVVVGSRTELEAGEQSLLRGEVAVAAVHFRRAGAWYVPFNPYSRRALERLETLATESEAVGDFPTALLCWRSIRGAILTARSAYTPYPSTLERADRHIAEIMASMDPPPIDVGKGREQVRREHYELLRDTARPHFPWVLFAMLGFGAWVLGAFALARGTFDDDGQIRWSWVIRVSAVVLLGVVAFGLGLRLA